MKRGNKILLALMLIVATGERCGGETWRGLKCSADGERRVPEGAAPDIGRFPWMALVQHAFYMGGKTRFAITAAVLIHPGFALAPAEDIARIPQDQITNNTHLIVWKSEAEKFSLDVLDYTLHPDYTEKLTLASVALVHLVGWVAGHNQAPVLPVCLPVKGGGVFDEIYVVKFTDDSKEIQKEVRKMYYVEDHDCQEFYQRSQLTYEKMAPRSPLCAASQAQAGVCVWDAGSALITRQHWGYWTLLGFGVRGPGCGAPARFAAVQPLLGWLDDAVAASRGPQEGPREGPPEGQHKFYLRQLSPYKLIMYKSDIKIPTEYGNCNRKQRGSVLFKDVTEVLMNKNFGQGFYFASIYGLAVVTCVTINFETQSRTLTGIWVEHHCQREMTGTARDLRVKSSKVPALLECFSYFNSVAFLEFRFFYSFKGHVEMTVFGQTSDLPMPVPTPWFETETTDAWWPTNIYFNYGEWFPMMLWLWHL